MTRSAGEASLTRVVQLRRFHDVEGFLAVAGRFLEEREAEHNLILGVCSRLRLDPMNYGSAPYLATVVEGRRVVATALRTPPYHPVLSEVDDDSAVEPLVLDLFETYGELPGVLGPIGAAALFARTWREATGAEARRSMSQRIYRAASASPPSDVPGSMRNARRTDRALLLDWFGAFQDEALPPAHPREDSEVLVDRRLGEPDAGLELWEDGGRPVSLAGYGGRTPHGIRVGPVYTPPEFRRRGYATALVGLMTKELLEGGRRFCFLFTDLANPTSNSIYRRIGYRPVTDVDQYTFG
jgi:uncharacterized protein